MRILILTNDRDKVKEIKVDSLHGPWADEWQRVHQYTFQEAMNEAARMEGGE